MSGEIYLLHFSRPVGALDNPRGQARHYVGWALDAEERNALHRAGKGAALTRAAVALGITWELFILGPGDRTLERRVKQLKAAPRLCPVCGRTHRGGRLHLPAARQLELFDPFDVPAPAPPARLDWLEVAHLRAASLAGYHGPGAAALAELDEIIPY